MPLNPQKSLYNSLFDDEDKTITPSWTPEEIINYYSEIDTSRAKKAIGGNSRSLANPTGVTYSNPNQPNQEKPPLPNDLNPQTMLDIMEQADILQEEDSPIQEEKSLLYKTGENLDAIIFAGLDAFVDTATFGTKDFLLEQTLGRVDPEELEEYRERTEARKELAAGKVSSAIGSFAGFVKGLPFKVAGNIVTKATLPVAKKVFKKKIGDKASTESTKQITKAGEQWAAKEGLSKNAIKLGTSKYTQVASKSRMHPILKQKTFNKALKEESEVLIQSQMALGKITQAEASIMRGMFDTMMKKGVPIQNMLQLGQVMYGTGRKGRFAGQLLNDAFVYSFIDGAFSLSNQWNYAREQGQSFSDVFSSRQLFEDTLFGMLTGVGLSGGAAIFKPLGKMANSRVDFASAIRTWRQSNPYAGKERRPLAKDLFYFGNHAWRNGRPHHVKFGKGKFEKEIDLTQGGTPYENAEDGIKSLHKELTQVLGGNYKKEVTDYLLKEKNQYARDLLSESLKEPFRSFAQEWPRMLYGGMVFNAGMIAQDAWNTGEFLGGYGEDYDGWDVFTNLMIGAYTQRKDNVSKWDMNTDVNRIREGIKILGGDPDWKNSNFYIDENFPIARSRFDKASRKKEYQDWLVENGLATNDEAEGREMDAFAVPAGEKSVRVSMQMESEDYGILQELVTAMNSDFHTAKTLDAITVKEANAMLKKYEEVHGIKKDDMKGLRDLQEESTIKATENFENEMLGIIKKIVDVADKESEFDDLAGFFTTTTGDKIITPQTIIIDKKLKDKIRKGDFEFLGSGDDAVNEVEKMKMSLQSIIKSLSSGLEAIQTSSNANVMELKNEASLRKIYEIVRNSEQSVNKTFEMKDLVSREFRYSDYMDYLPSMVKNKAISVSKSIQEIFSPEFNGRQKLLGALQGAGLIDKDGNIIKSVKQIEFSKDVKADVSKEEQASMKRILGQVLTMQSSINIPDKLTSSNTIVNKDGFVRLKKTLQGFGLDVKKLDSFYYEYLINILNTKRFKDSRLSGGQTDFVLQAVSSGFGENNLKPEGTSNNFILKRIEIFGNDDFSTKYNNFISEIANKSGGLVEISKETIDVGIMEIPILQAEMKKSALGRNTYDSNVALGTVLEKLTQNGLGFYSDRIKNYIALAPEINQAKIQNMLFDLGVLKINEDSGRIEVEEKEILTEDYWKKVDKSLRQFGYTEGFINQKISEQKQISKPRFLNDSSDHVANPSMSVGEFFRKYKVIINDSDGNFKEYRDYSLMSQESQIKKFDELTKNFPEIENPNAILKGNAISNLINNLVATRIITDADGNKKQETIPYESMGGRLRNQILEDATQVFFGRRKQVEVQVVEVAGTGIKFTDKPEFHQTNPIYELFTGLKIKHYLFDNNVLIKPFNPENSRMEPRIVNLTSKAENFPEWMRNEVKIVENQIINDLLNHSIVDGILKDNRIKDKEDEVFESLGVQDDVVSIGKDPLIRLNLVPEFDSIIITGQDRKILAEEFNNFYERNKDLYEDTTNIEALLERIKDTDKDRYSADYDYESIARLLVVERMLRSDSNIKLKEILNNNDADEIDKVISRVKLVNTKNFIRGDSDYYLSLAEARLLINDGDEAGNLLKDRIYNKKGKYSIAIWDDDNNANIRTEVQQIVDKYKDIYDLEGWSFENILGTAHEEASAFDSISFLTEDAMMEYHTLMGHNPYSKNAIKPVISSMGEGKTLLLGKTLFIHDPRLENFLKANNLDILLTKSGAKVYDEKYIDGNSNKDDESILNISLDKLKTTSKNILKPNQIRFVDIDAIGLKPEKDASITSAKDSPADANYHNAEEGYLKIQEMQKDISFAIQSIEDIVGSSVAMREFMMDELLPNGQMQNDDGISSLQTINNMYLFLEHHANANPMSFSDNQTKNKIFNTFIDRLINNTRSITNRSSGRHGELSNVTSNRYGGQSYIIQNAQRFLDRNGNMRNHRLLPTLVDKQGNMLMRGELALPFHEQDTKLGDLEGRTIRIVDNERIMTVDEFLDDYKERVGESDKKNELSLSVQNSTLGSVHNFLKDANKATGRKYQIGIISRRNPRTRPNDITLLGLAGFLDKGYGNSTMVNSLDIVNIYEGDYDADKVDYFFAHNDYMFDHIKRTNKYWVQGIDPKKWKTPASFTFLQDTETQSENIIESMGNADAYKKMIGIVQKTPRQLNYLDMLSNKNWTASPEESEAWSNYRRENKDGTVDGPGILFRTTDSKNGDERVITIDSKNIDFFIQSALEMQYVVDGKNKLNPNIANDIFNWKDNFLFPLITQSERPDNLSFNQRKDIQEKGTSNNKRIRIFSRMVKKDGKWTEDVNIELTKAEKEIIKSLMDNYNKTILQATGKDVYDGADVRRMSYDDFMQAGQGFIDFHKDIQNKVYRKLTKERKLSGNDFKELKRIFGAVTEKEPQKGKWYRRTFLNKDPFEYVRNNAERFISEETTNPNGTYIDQLIVQLARKNHFEEKQDFRLLGEDKIQIDDWYNDMIMESYKESADKHNEKLTTAVLSHNKKVGSVVYLSRKINEIARSKYKQEWKNKKIKSLKYVINKLQSEINTEYGRRVNIKDPQKYEFLDLIAEGKELTESTIYYHSIHSLLKSELIGGYKFDNFYQMLEGNAKDDLAMFKDLRRKIYGDHGSIKDILEFGAKTVIKDKELKKQLERYDTDDFYKWQVEFLKEKTEQYGLEFMLAFMSPSLNRKKIGVFNNRVVPIPYVDSKRFRMGIRVLTEIAFKDFSSEENPIRVARKLVGESEDIKIPSQILLTKLIESENHYRGYFDRNHNLFTSRENDVRQYGLGKFDSYLERKLSSYTDINWTRNMFPRHTLNIMNNSVLDFYQETANLAGDEFSIGFQKFLDEIDLLNRDLATNVYLDPYDFIERRLKLDNMYIKMVQTEINAVSESKSVVPIQQHDSFKLSKGFKYLQRAAADKGLKLEVNESSLISKYNKLQQLERELNTAHDGRLLDHTNKDAEDWAEMSGCIK